MQKTKIRTTEEMHKFNIGKEDTETVKDFTYCGAVISSNVDSAKKSREG